MSSSRLKPAQVLLLIALGMVVVYGALSPYQAPIKSNLDLPTIMGALGGLFIIVLLIERATEIAMGVWREPYINALTQKVASLSQASDAQTQPQPPHDSALQQAQTELAVAKSNNKRVAFMISLTLAVLTCAGGVGILNTIVDCCTKANPSLIRGIDIVLTSGLLSGGSDSFHQFVRAIEDFFTGNNKNPSQ